MSKPMPSEPVPSTPTWESLEELVRGHVRSFVQMLLEEEVTELLSRRRYERKSAVDPAPGYRNGYGKPRRVSMSCGTITVRRPRVRGLEERFVSRLLPLFVRRTQQVADLLPQLYLHGLSQGDFELALRGLLGDGAPLSSSSIQRLKGKFQEEYDAWKERPLHDREVVYLWADGVYVKAGLEKQKAALLVVVAALSDGRKEVVAVTPGHRESSESWASVFRDLRDRGLRAPRLVVADGNTGVWDAVTDVWPDAGEQRCWNHKIVNVLDKLPKKEQDEARALLCQIPYQPSRKDAKVLRARFARRYKSWYPKAVATLERDWDRMVTFYDFPEAHWKHIRTTNVVESPFASVRLRTNAAKRFKKVDNATALIWRVLMVAEKRFRRINAPALAAEVFHGRKFRDGHLLRKQVETDAA